MNYIKDFVILLLSLCGSVASIASIYYFDQQDQGKVALIILGVLLCMSMCHDWYYIHKVRQKERYTSIPEDLNTIYSQIRCKYENVQEITNHERSKDCIVLNFRLLINQNAKKMALPAQPF